MAKVYKDGASIESKGEISIKVSTDGRGSIDIPILLNQSKDITLLTVWFEKSLIISHFQLNTYVLIRGIKLQPIDEVILELVLDLLDKCEVYSAYQEHLETLGEWHGYFKI